MDRDRVANADDDCPNTSNPAQEDADGFGDACDAAPLAAFDGLWHSEYACTSTCAPGQSFTGNFDVTSSAPTPAAMKTKPARSL